jgi:hypothetical protein
MGSLYPTDIVVGQRKEREKKSTMFFCLSTDAGRRKSKRKKISARYTLLYICILFVVVGTAAALIGSSI